MVGEIRGKGLIGACELVKDKKKKIPFPADKAVGAYCLERMKKNGLLARAIGDAMCLCPPLISSEDEIGEIFVRYTKSLDETLDWAHRQGFWPHETGLNLFLDVPIYKNVLTRVNVSIGSNW